eukprot:CAMPEP_0113969890 /NCGR_PEP_ID=MMETSP0011_2-20120614/10675_1 /TAXON_ID=101924 /ORGANISM="Rhodosorus marinus" /LENGTH=305 /DNA_ID=CAMNT_0000983811 /DNA_START=67 /DNA_END=983 /DNA_ORIENTATION=- /assembly_acc=CAM_ASM_000156
MATPEILGKANEGNATLIARPEALLKFEETQERNASRPHGLQAVPPRGGQNPGAGKRKGGFFNFLFCGGEDESVQWVKVELEEEDKASTETRERVAWNESLHLYVLSCIDHLAKYGENEARLFAVSGSQQVIEEMRMQYGELLPEGTDVHVACAVLKQAVRDAESPLIDIEALQAWAVATASKKKQPADADGEPLVIPSFKESLLYSTLQIVREKSPRRAFVLARLMYLLGDISSRIEITQMNSHNLSLCLAPSLLQWDPYADAALLVLGRMTAYVMELIDDGREHAEKLRDYCLELQNLASLPY